MAERIALEVASAGSADVDRRMAEAMSEFLVGVGEEPVVAFDRATLVELLNGWRIGSVSPEEVRAKVWRCWLAGLARAEDVLVHDTLFFLTNSHLAGLRQDDVAALVDYLATPPGSEDQARERFYEHLVSGSASDALEASRPASAEHLTADEHDVELSWATPTQRRLSRAVSSEPESIWPELAERLCSSKVEDEMLLAHVLEELVYRHAESFIDRIERLAAACPAARERIAAAHVGGVGATLALERFWSLQEKLRVDDHG
ncbi:MAG TPA: hypothetical protein VH741_09185 [Candidatus Limnocylindrales bacterium]